MKVIAEPLLAKRPAVDPVRRRQRERLQPTKRKCPVARTGVSEFGKRRRQVVHIPQLDDVVSRAPTIRSNQRTRSGIRALPTDLRRKDRSVLVHGHLRQTALVRLQRVDRFRESNVP